MLQRKNKWYILELFFLLFLLSYFSSKPLISKALAQNIPNYSTTLVDQNINTGYALYPAGANQKIVENQYGIFMTHVLNEDASSYTWRLSRSVDGGKTFSTITTEIGGTRAPALATDSTGRLYVAFPDWFSGDGNLRVYSAANNFTQPTSIVIPGGGKGAGKYTLQIDESRGRLYFFTGNYDGSFFVMDLNGNLISTYRLVSPSSDVGIMYPYLYLDRQDRLFAAWSAARLTNSGIRGPIFFAISTDGAQTWHTIRGSSLPVPMPADGSGGADMVSLSDDYQNTRDSWLSTIFVNDGKVHFHYYALDGTSVLQRYVRFDIATGTREVITGDQATYTTAKDIRMDGYGRSCTSINETGTIYCFVRDSSAGYTMADLKLAIVTSIDNGSTWNKYLVTNLNYPGSFDLSRKIGSDGYFFGSVSNAPVDWLKNNVYFFKFAPINPIPIATPSVTLEKPAETDNLLKSAILSGTNVAVTFDTTNASANDWISIYKQGTADTAFLSWKWINDATGTAPTTLTTNGTVTLTVSNTTDTYEVRYFAKGGYQLLGSMTVSTGSTPKLGDLNNDAKVDGTDYTIFVNDFGKTGSPGFIHADLNNDGKVDIFDYAILVENYGK